MAENKGLLAAAAALVNRQFDSAKHPHGLGRSGNAGGGQQATTNSGPVARMRQIAAKLHGKSCREIIAAACAAGINPSTASVQLARYQRERAAQEFATLQASGQPMTREALQNAAARVVGVPEAPTARSNPAPERDGGRAGAVRRNNARQEYDDIAASDDS